MRNWHANCIAVAAPHAGIQKTKAMFKNEQTMKNMIKLITASLVFSLGLAVVHGQVSGNIAIQSDYVWRGLTQNEGDVSFQGGFDFEDESGFYAGVWGANVNFGGASTEGDLYIGFANEIEGFEYDVGIIEYTYHGSSVASDNNFTEYYVSGGIAGFGLSYAFGDEFGDNVEVGYGFDIEGISIGAAYGDYEDSHEYWTVGVSGEIEGIGWDISYWDVDMDDGSDMDSSIVFTISKSL